jgi:hypothetical protein
MALRRGQRISRGVRVCVQGIDFLLQSSGSNGTYEIKRSAACGRLRESQSQWLSLANASPNQRASSKKNREQHAGSLSPRSAFCSSP